MTKSIVEIVKRKICCGCGACTVACPASIIKMNYGERFNYPQIVGKNCNSCGRCLSVCPSTFLLRGVSQKPVNDPSKMDRECYLVHSKDNEIRYNAASGGFVTGLILHLIENQMADGGIVALCEGENPLVARSFIARDKRSLISASGSKYAPVSSCVVLKEVLSTPGNYVFVGTPCMIYGLNKLEKLYPELKTRIIVSIGFVCAGMASRLSTRNYIENDGKVDLNSIHCIRYRGDGWPGRFKVFGKDGKVLMDRPLIGGSLTHVVGVDHYLRCENCIDHWAEGADITVSDPWTEKMIENESIGMSAIMIRSEKGKNAINSAIQSGDLVAQKITTEEMATYNKHLIITPDHERMAWLALYQLLFLRRLEWLPLFLKLLLNRKIVGIRTTLKALINRNYYF